MLLGYTRVSTSEQAADGTTSLAEQERVIRGYAMMKGQTGFDVQVFTDSGISGSLPLHLRPAGADMLELAKKGDMLVAAKLDRMFRNSFDAMKVYAHCIEQGIDLILLDLGAEPVTREGTVSKVIYTVMAAFADFDRGRIRERMLDGKLAKVRNGGHIGGEAPFGFRVEGKGRTARLVENDAEQAVVATLASERANHPSMAMGELTNRLNALGHRTRAGKPFQIVQVQRMLARIHEQSSTTH